MSDAKVYYAKMKKVTVSIPVRGDEGEIIYQVNEAGNYRRNHQGVKIPVMRQVVFLTVSANPKIGYLAKYTAVDPAEVAHLDDLAQDASSPILSEEAYKKSVNAAAYEAEQRLKVAEERASNLAAALESKDKITEAMQRELEELRTEQGAAGKKLSGEGGGKRGPGRPAKGDK